MPTTFHEECVKHCESSGEKVELKERPVSANTSLSGDVFILRRVGAGICVVELYSGISGIQTRYSAAQN